MISSIITFILGATECGGTFGGCGGGVARGGLGGGRFGAIMGDFAVRGRLRVIGWISTGVMAAASVGMFVLMVM